MTGCTTDELADMNEQSGGPGINFGVTATSTDRLSRGGLTSTYQSLTLKSAETADTLAVTVETADYFIEEKQISRGTPIDGAENLDNFQVYAYYYASESTTTPSLFFEENVSKKDADTWATGTTYYWPTSGELAFFGMSPAVNNDFLCFDRYQAPAGENDAVISYIAPTEPEQQPDIVVASTDRMNNSESGEKVPMAFKHILSQVKFRVGTEMQAGTINSITLTNVVKHGYYHHAANGGAWSLDEAGEDQTCNYTVDLDEAVTEGSTGTDLGVTEKTLMMLPQTLGANCELVVEFVGSDGETRTLRAPLAGGEWTMGGTTVYNINIEPEYTLKFVSTPEVQDAHYVVYPITINADKLPDGWTITSNDPSNVTFVETFADEGIKRLVDDGYWLKDNCGTATLTSKTQGDVQVYVFLKENIGEADRDITLTLSSAKDNKTAATFDFKQYCPAWENGIGVERIQDKDYPWGFLWDSSMKITYSMPNNFLTGIIHILFSVFGDHSYVTQSGYVLMGNWKVTVDFSKVPKLDTAVDDNDGLSNTWSLYNFDGINEASTIMDQLVSWGGVPDKTLPSNPSEFAAWACAKKNMYTAEPKTEGGQTVYKPVLSKNDMVWYLPAKNQTVNVKDNTMQGLYWTSTASGDTDAWQYEDTGSQGTSYRNDVLHVRAVRNRNN